MSGLTSSAKRENNFNKIPTSNGDVKYIKMKTNTSQGVSNDDSEKLRKATLSPPQFQKDHLQKGTAS